MRLAAYDYNVVPAPPTSADPAAMWGPYIQTCIDLFGAHRAMFESNFPVDKMGVGYAALWNAFKRIAAGASRRERALFHDNARRVSRLGAAKEFRHSPGFEAFDEVSDRGPRAVDGSPGGFVQQRLEPGEGGLDRVEVWRVGRR